jgi:hypothetical protein
MQFGLTSQERVKKYIVGWWKFAWLPTKMSDGSWVWLQEFWMHYPGAWDAYRKHFFLYTIGGFMGDGEIYQKKFATLPSPDYMCKYANITEFELKPVEI